MAELQPILEPGITPPPLPTPILITGINSAGEGVGRRVAPSDAAAVSLSADATSLGKVVFVPNSCVGDRILPLRIIEKKHYDRVTDYRLIQPGENREAHPERLCPQYGVCGGCDYLHIRYPEQLSIKAALVREALTRLGKLSLPDSVFKPIVPSPKRFHYRNKAQFHLSEQGIGFFRSHSHRVVPIRECPLLSDAIQPFRLLPLLSRLQNGQTPPPLFPSAPPAGNAREHRPGALSPAILCAESRTPPQPPLLSFSRKRGEAASFSQVNDGVNRLIRLELIRWAESRFPLPTASSPRLLMDLFCGNANWSLPLRPFFDTLIGVDLSASNIQAAREGAARQDAAAKWGNAAADRPPAPDEAGGTEKTGGNPEGRPPAAEGVSRGECCFFAEDCLAFLRRRKSLLHPAPTLLILDPPKRGAASLIPEIAALRPAFIFYISCDPTTLARDLGILLAQPASGYQIESVTPYDMFPQTRHVETVVLLSKVDETAAGGRQPAKPD